MSFIPLPLFLSASLYIVINILKERGGAVQGDVPGRCGLLELWIGGGSVGGHAAWGFLQDWRPRPRSDVSVKFCACACVRKREREGERETRASFGASNNEAELGGPAGLHLYKRL